MEPELQRVIDALADALELMRQKVSPSSYGEIIEEALKQAKMEGKS